MNNISFQYGYELLTQAASIVFVDANVRKRYEFVNIIQPHIAAYVLPLDVDGVDYITHTLEHYPCRGEAIAHIHIIAHGLPGGIDLGNSQLSLSNIEQYVNSLREWFLDFRQQHLLHRYLTKLSHRFTPSPVPHLSLYGCDVAAGDAEAEFLDRLQDYTGAVIQANPTLGWPFHSTNGSVLPFLTHPSTSLSGRRTLTQLPSELSESTTSSSL